MLKVFFMVVMEVIVTVIMAEIIFIAYDVKTDRYLLLNAYRRAMDYKIVSQAVAS